jgi:hypothetical protein
MIRENRKLKSKNFLKKSGCLEAVDNGVERNVVSPTLVSRAMERRHDHSSLSEKEDK